MREYHDLRILRGIAIYKFLKVAGLLILALGAFEFSRKGELQPLLEGIRRIPIVAGHETLRRMVAGISGLPPQRFELAGSVALAYAILFGIEGYGLWKQRRWAETLTVLATASLIPFELWALAERLTPLRVLAVSLNVAIVVYLMRLLGRRRRSRTNLPAGEGN